MIWSVPKSWDGETAVILAGGPSLRGFDVQPLMREFDGQPLTLSGLRVITINDSWRIAPWADIQYFCDRDWRDTQVLVNRQSLDKSTDFARLIYKGFWVKGGADLDHPHVRTLKFSGQLGLSDDPTALRHGSNSGYQAIGLAYLLGAKRILLLGYDMQAAKGERTHWHDEERRADFWTTVKDSMLPLFPALVEPLARAGVEVINCTPGSALKCWPYLPLEEALNKEKS
jgi:hypothetical protein